MWRTSQKVNRPRSERPYSSPSPLHPGLGVRSPLFTRHCCLQTEIRIADIISAVEFDSTGNYLATGDKGGRVVLFERNDMVCSPLCPLYQWSLITLYDHLRNIHLFDIQEKELRI